MAKRLGRPPKKRKDRKSTRKGGQVILHASDFYANTPEGRAKQLANIRPEARGKKSRNIDPDAPKPLSVDKLVLQKLDIIEFATQYLNISFAKRPAQEVLLRAQYGLDMTDAQKEIYKQLTDGRDYEPGTEQAEGEWVLGRRSGKSWLVAVISLYESICRANIHRRHIGENQIAYAVLVATKLQQCIEIVQSYCEQILVNSILSHWIEESIQGKLLLTNNMCIQSFPCNSMAGRGYPVYLLVLDEVGHFYTEGVRADKTVFEALHPGTAQFPNAKTLLISSPMGKAGLFFEWYDEGFDVPGRLTVQAETKIINPEIPIEFLEKERKRDPDNYAREFGAEFCESVEGYFVSCLEKLEACFQLAEDYPVQRGNIYYAAIDQSGLAGRDRFALSITHRDYSGKIIVDVLRSWFTRDLDIIMAEIKQVCVLYGVHTVSIDNYAKGFVQTALEKIGLIVTIRELLPLLYINFKTLVLSGSVLLPANPALRKGLIQTQGFIGKSNRLGIGHPRDADGHGDEADAVVASVYDCSKDLSIGTLASASTDTTTREQDDKMCNYDVLGF